MYSHQPPYFPNTLPALLRKQVELLHALPCTPDHETLSPRFLFLSPSVENFPIRELPLNLRGIQFLMLDDRPEHFEVALAQQLNTELQEDGTYEFVYRANLHEGLYSLEKKGSPDKRSYLLTRKSCTQLDLHF